ncbi:MULTISPECIES: LysR family transcriptional regulator [unclassified Vibrio]|uniref:LysR family transcriptional regulator n=1 Tax=unclassified Vibrio TaxID=2614977 RepID=UPI0013617C89|nr:MULTISPECIES: LysR family transcriptional regulator [unclassified Vibrio]NAW59513.1 LysR family transcriptional regulator [Vibrio sp. V36_P2S2PM302]NAX19937.1 LysR family transcriptional regulator [Vibrio sp. V39_P1S14PM300]NAX25248.1 LysR family transcriptional regulator [Vibrio sp. V38_P2S17PM301]NAX28869.1 LysR family transcriptional regulator [Vibrio sp. V37_P2S8PM304]
MLLEGIETLLVLSKEKTMSRTGSVLYISQSAVSKRIANLEQRLGKKLIEPSGRHIKLTADACALIDSIGPSFNELRGLIFDQQSLQDDSLLRIDCSETLLAGYLGPALQRYMQTDRHLTLTTNHTPRIIENVQSGKATIGFCAGHLPAHHGLLSFHLCDEPFMVVFHRPLTTIPEQLLTNDLINPANSYQRAALAKLGVQPLMEMDSYTATAQLGLAGVAPALVPLSIIQALSIAPEHCFSFAQLKPLYRPIHLCVRPKSYQSERVKTVITTIADAVPTAVLLPSTSTS